MGWTIAKGLLLGFWLVALGNLLSPLPAPWDAWLQGAAAITLLLHLLELVLLRHLLRGLPAPAWQGLQVLLFGLLHLLPLRRRR